MCVPKSTYVYLHASMHVCCNCMLTCMNEDTCHLPTQSWSPSEMPYETHKRQTNVAKTTHSPCNLCIRSPPLTAPPSLSPLYFPLPPYLSNSLVHTQQDLPVLTLRLIGVSDPINVFLDPLSTLHLPLDSYPGQTITLQVGSQSWKESRVQAACQ